MSKTVIEFNARRITYETSVPIGEVLARLDKEINKKDGSPEVFRVMRVSKSKAELVEGINALTDGRDFVHFMDNPYHRWLNTYLESTRTPQTYLYVLGNPLIAQGMLKYDLTGALHIPPRILITEKAEGSGTRVVYDDPATMIPVPSADNGGRAVQEELRIAAEGLSEKLEKLVQLIVRVDEST